MVVHFVVMLALLAPVGRQFQRGCFASCQNFVVRLLLLLCLIVHACQSNILSEYQCRKLCFLGATRDHFLIVRKL